MAGRTGRPPRRGAPLTPVPRLARLPLWPTLVAVSLLVLLVQVPQPHATAWHFFEDAARLLIGDGPAGQGAGLHLYRDHPELQFGPLSIVAALPLVLLGEALGPWAAMVVASIAGLVAVALVLDTARDLAMARGRHLAPAPALVAGVVVVVTWGDVAVRTAHLDDAIALLALVAALRWCALGLAWPVVLAVAVAAAAKPWAVVLAPLVLVVPGARRHRRLVVVGALVAATWAPFVLAEPATLELGRFEIRNDPTSVLRALGVDDPSTPAWARPAQLVGGVVVVGIVVLAGRWPAALLVGLAWRLLLEPGAHRYYTVGIVLGAVLVELVRRPRHLPWVTVAAAVVLEATAWQGFPGSPGSWLRLGGLVVTVVVLGAPPVRGCGTAAVGGAQALGIGRTRTRVIRRPSTSSTTSS